MTPETEMVPEPDWLAAESSDRAKLTAIMAAVRRCYAECRIVHTSEATGSHLTTTMAELFIGQLLIKAEARAIRTATAEMFEEAIRSATDDVMAQKLPEVEAKVRADERERIRRWLIREGRELQRQACQADPHGPAARRAVRNQQEIAAGLLNAATHMEAAGPDLLRETS